MPVVPAQLAVPSVTVHLLTAAVELSFFVEDAERPGTALAHLHVSSAGADVRVENLVQKMTIKVGEGMAFVCLLEHAC